MDPADFKAPEAGSVIRTAEGHPAFVPRPLPPRLVYDADLVAALSRADAALGELSGLGRQLPNPGLLIGSYIRREAVWSSRIEGTQAELSDVLLDEVEAGSGADLTDVREVRNYVAALTAGTRRLAELALSLRLVRELHAELMTGVRGGRATPGEFRRSQNWIGPAGSTLATAVYVPPPPLEMMEALDHWERFLHVRGELPDLIQCALIHEHFEAIHPFLDGNGRVGRLLIPLFLIERGRLTHPLLYLSDYLEARRSDYYELLHRIRTHGDWQGWLRFFLEGVQVTARQALAQAKTLLELRERWRRELERSRRAMVLVDALFENPYTSAAQARRRLGVSDPTARQVIRTLEAAGVLEEVTGRSWGRIYVARSILEAIERRSQPEG